MIISSQSFNAMYTVEVKGSRNELKTVQIGSNGRIPTKKEQVEMSVVMSKLQKSPKFKEKRNSNSNSQMRANSVKRSLGKPFSITNVDKKAEKVAESKVNIKQPAEKKFGGIPNNKDFCIKSKKLSINRPEPKPIMNVTDRMARCSSSSKASGPASQQSIKEDRIRMKISSAATQAQVQTSKSASVPPAKGRNAQRQLLALPLVDVGLFGRLDWRSSRDELGEGNWVLGRLAHRESSPSPFGTQPTMTRIDDYQLDNLAHMIIEEADNMIEESDKENEFIEERDMLIKAKKAGKKTKANILADLIPLNLAEEKIKFYSLNCRYNPQFVYLHEKITLKYNKPHTQFVKEAKDILEAVLKKYGSDEYFFACQGSVVSQEATGKLV